MIRTVARLMQPALIHGALKACHYLTQAFRTLDVYNPDPTPNPNHNPYH